MMSGEGQEQPHDNLLSADDASFESSVGTWTAGANCTIATSSTTALDKECPMASEPKRWLGWIVWRTMRWKSGRPSFDEFWSGFVARRRSRGDR